MNKNINENYAYYIFGQNLKKYRKLKGWTQETLSEKSLYALSFIKNIEAEKVFQTLSLGTCYKFAELLGVPLSKLFEEPVGLKEKYLNSTHKEKELNTIYEEEFLKTKNKEKISV